MFCEIEHLTHIFERTWTGVQVGKKDVYNARCRTSKELGYSQILFHSLVYPQYTNIKHNDGNCLNNKRVNISDLNNIPNTNLMNNLTVDEIKEIHDLLPEKKIPCKKKCNTVNLPEDCPKVIGVTYSNATSRWKVRGIDENGKKWTKSFSISKHGNTAYPKAVLWRQTYHKNK